MKALATYRITSRLLSEFPTFLRVWRLLIPTLPPPRGEITFSASCSCSLNKSVGVRGNAKRDADLGMLTTDEIEADQIRIFFVSNVFLRRKFLGLLFARFCGVELDALL